MRHYWIFNYGPIISLFMKFRNVGPKPFADFYLFPMFFNTLLCYHNYLRLGHNSIFSICQFSLIIWYKASLWVYNVLVKNDQIHPKKASRNKYFRIDLN